MTRRPLQLPTPGFIITLIVGLLVAFALGKLAGNGDFEKIAAIVTITVAFLVCMILKTRIWLIIPFCWTLTGQISVLPLPFSVRELAALTVFALFLGFYALKLIPKSHPTGWIDGLVILNVCYLATVYLRNPVGLSAFGSSMVGGRPYFSVFIACLVFWILSRVSIGEKMATRLPLVLFMGPMLMSTIGLFTYWFPSTVPFIAPFYNGLSIENYMESQQSPIEVAGPEGSGRITSLAPVGQIGILALASYFRPISFLLPINPIRFILFSLFVLATLLSGFRGAFINVGVSMLLSSHYRSGSKDVLRILFFSGAVLLVAIIGNGTMFTLPLSVQRTLSFLPGHWDERAAEEATDSTNWRTKMWKEVWFSDKWIKNKILGDGFGFSEYDLRIMQEGAWGGPGFIGGSTSEAQMIQGAYHSGPLSAIRYVGIIGLLLYVALLLLLASQAVKFIRRATGTAFLPAALFIGIPLIFEPFNYLFIFGGYDSGISNTIFNAALLKMLDVSLKKVVDNTTPIPSSIEDRLIHQPL